MSDALPDPLIPPETPAGLDRRIVLTAVISVALHLALVGWLVLPRLHRPEAAEPPAINVDLVPPEVPSSAAPPSSSSAPMSSEAPPSSQSPSSAAGASSVSPSSEPVSSEAAAAAAASSVAAESSAAASSASAEAPAPRGRPVVIPVGRSEASSAAEPSSEAQSSASEASAAGDASQLTASGSGAADAVADPSGDSTTPKITGALHVAKRHYLEAMLDAPAMARARDAIRTLPPEKRLTQSCNIEAVGQLGNAGRSFDPDAVVADAFARPAIDTAAARVSVSGGAFRSKGKWYGIAYDCTLSPDLGAVKSFSYRIGTDVTAELRTRLGR